jgi:signal-transduction protein with cAMP-binding, CBS, and nucleotidyltransferase domain
VLVTRGNQTVGLMTVHGIKEVPRPEWSSKTAAETMVPMDRLKRINPEAELWTALEEMARDGVNQLPVMRDGTVLGMLGREDVINFLRTLQEVGT